ncbi:MAG: hypothetical protein HYS81_00605 [Candidatus Aenigmatarchaeota archaeon]|nr:MAG: hypothetical protein HYS81_00605 [Candidatus Aenigmarchaeota archaeon]
MGEPEGESCDDVDKMMKGLDRALKNYDNAGNAYGKHLLEEMKRNPEEGIKLIRPSMGKAIRDAYDGPDGLGASYVMAMAGGPHESITAPIYNAVGAVYPYLTREQREAALREVLGMMDHNNYLIVQTAHTPFIRNPILLSDITIPRPHYGPGLDGENQGLIKKGRAGEEELKAGRYEDFESFAKECILPDGLFDPDVVRNDFIVGFSVLRSDYCDWGADYVRVVDGEFLEQTMRGIVSMRFAPRRGKETTTESIERGTARLKELLPESLHDRIEPLRLQADWIDATKFA